MTDTQRKDMLGCYNRELDMNTPFLDELANGGVLEAIEANAEETCIIYTSDHGAGLGSRGIADKGFDMDIPKSLEGKSLLPVFEDNDVKVNKHVFMEFGRYEVDHDGFGGFQPIRAVTDGRYKLSVNLMTSDELYDTLDDSGEMVNLIEDERYMEIRSRLHDEILNWMNETRDPFRGYYWERRPWREDAREATWDYTGMTRQRYTEPEEVHQLDYATGMPITEYIRRKQ